MKRTLWSATLLLVHWVNWRKQMKTVLLVVACLMCVFATGCTIGASENGSNRFNEQHSTIWVEGLEPDKEVLPSYKDVSDISIGMSKNEVLTICGSPQRAEEVMRPVNPHASIAYPRICYIYDTMEGISVGVFYHAEYADGQSGEYVWKVDDIILDY